ncbi:hypothetical protein [Kibdelosporangium aridum]|uniref:Ankyrin repeat domain-containing protein n=1 Tax=Kibdelosporangium aridum TaxID=2030 RepID=A0A1W2G0E2_KIBAR|nr:hypothetical protein [Kibdelosporangium aridum]SMD27583.1 hypothetical protein SAMN05661093_11193 [Kibdelosporangium aridum]
METVAEHGWDTRLGAAPAAGPAEEFCRLACLTYSREDGPERWAQARQLLAERPDLTTLNIWAAAAAARPDDVGRLLAEQPRRVAERGGPFRWRPLFYLVYSRFDQAVPAERVLAVARQLLDAGADPDDGYLFDAPGPVRERTPFGRRVVWCRGGGPARLWARVTPLDRSCLVHDPRGVSGPLPWPVDPGLSIVVRARPRGAHLAIRRAAELRREDRDRAGCRDRERLNRREGQRASS